MEHLDNEVPKNPHLQIVTREELEQWQDISRRQLNNITAENGETVEGKKRALLDIYPEAEALVTAIENANGFHEVSIITVPYGPLAAYGDQDPAEGPFWTVLRSDSRPDYFYVFSIALQRNQPSIALRRRNGSDGWGGVARGSEAQEKCIDNNFATVTTLYNGWFVKDRPSQAK